MWKDDSETSGISISTYTRFSLLFYAVGLKNLYVWADSTYNFIFHTCEEMRDQRRMVAFFYRIERNLWLSSLAGAKFVREEITREEFARSWISFPSFFLYAISLASGVYLRQGETNAPDYFSRIYANVFLDRMRYWFSRENIQILI